MRYYLAITVVLAAACSAPANAPETTVEAEGTGLGQLVVTGEDGSVSLVDPTTGAAVEIEAASVPGVAVQPTPSPDGTIVVWTSLDGAQPTTVVFESGAMTSIEMVTAPFYYQFSPDSRRLVGLGNDPDGGGVAAVVIDLEGVSAEVVDADQPYYLDWSPASDRLFGHLGGTELATVELDGTRTPIDVESAVFQAPDWVNESAVVVARSTEAITAARVAVQTRSFELAVIDPESGGIVTLAPVGFATGFTVSPEGSRMAYIDVSEPVGAMFGELRVVDLDGVSDVIDVASGVTTFDWSPDGTKLLFGIVDEEAGLVPHVWDGTDITRYDSYTPTPRFVSEYLPFWSQYIRSITQWAPDGSAFAYSAVDGEGSSVWVQSLVGDPRRLGGGDMVVWSR